MKYLLDTNVLSEQTRPDPDASVLVWMRHHQGESVINPIILGELQYGILCLPPGQRRTRLEAWFARSILCVRVLDFDAPCALEWARLLASLKRNGRAMPLKDSLIAATALAYGLAVATRNEADFLNAGVPVINPFAPDGKTTSS